MYPEPTMVPQVRGEYCGSPAHGAWRLARPRPRPPQARPHAGRPHLQGKEKGGGGYYYLKVPCTTK